MSAKSLKIILIATFVAISQIQCTNNNTNMSRENKIAFLHHSTGLNIWKGGVSKYSWKIFKKGAVQKWIKAYNKANNTEFEIKEFNYPVGIDNMPFDYYNLWIKNVGVNENEGNYSLDKLSKEFGLIVLKHCYPVSEIIESSDSATIDSNKKTLEIYKLQYLALREKMQSYKDTKFILWTGPTHVMGATTEDKALRMKQFVDWVKTEWDQKGDNIFLWDFYDLETEGGIYLKDEYAVDPQDSHPNKTFSAMVSPFFAQRIVDVLKGEGDIKSISGK